MTIEINRIEQTNNGHIQSRYQQGVEKNSDNENDRNNGLRMNNEITIK